MRVGFQRVSSDTAVDTLVERCHSEASRAMLRSGTMERSRRAIRVCGVVQGVGFRPAVYRLARAAGLGAIVRNDSDGVWIEIEGDPAAVDGFASRLTREAPPLAGIERLEEAPLPVRGEREFRVAASVEQEEARTIVPADAAVCAACLAEMRAPADRRHRYPFVNCTDCGLRYTIVRACRTIARTTMRAAMCGACRPSTRTRRADDSTPRPTRAPPAARRSSCAEDRESSGSVETRPSRAPWRCSPRGDRRREGLEASSSPSTRRTTPPWQLRRTKAASARAARLAWSRVTEAQGVVRVDDVARAALESPARPIVARWRAAA